MTPKMPTAEMTRPRRPKRLNISMLSRRSAVCAARRSSRRATFRSGTCRQHLRDDGSERRERVVRIAARVQEDEAVRLAAPLRHRQVHLGMRADLEARLPRVGHDAHDAPLAVADVDDDATERVVTAKEHARRRVAEDDDGFRPFTIVVREVPAAPEGDRQRPVVAGGDELHAHRLVVVERLARRLQRADLQVDAERNTGRRRGGVDHAGQLARAVDDVGQGRPHVGLRRSGTRALNKLRREHALGAESRIDAHDVDEAADEQRRAHEQHDGQRDLGDDQHRTSATAAAARAAATGALVERG